MQLTAAVRVFIPNANLNYFQRDSEVLYKNIYTHASRIDEIKKGVRGHNGHFGENKKGLFKNLESKYQGGKK